MSKEIVRIFSGTSNRDLAEKVVSNLNTTLGKIEFKKFSDGETLPIFKENIRGRVVFIIQSCYAPFDNYWELFQMIDAAKRGSASKVIPILSYMGYGRQDRKDQPRVCVSSKIIANFLETLEISRLLTIDLHTDQITSFFNIPVDQLYASYVFIPYIKSLKLDNIIVASPDMGGTKRAKNISEFLNCEMVICYKHRLTNGDIDEMLLIGDVKDKNVIIVDDICDTATTLCKSAKVLMENGAKSVRAAITHPVMSGNAYDNIKNSVLTELIVTDTIPLKEKLDNITVLSISNLLSKAITNIVDNKSLSKLFIKK